MWAGAPRGARIAWTLLIAASAGALASALHLPLPWMLGPLISTAVLSMCGVPLAASQRLRDAGQWAIGTALGLYFTAEVLATLGRLSWAIALGVLWALALGYGFYRFLAWRHRSEPGLHPGSAFFATAIGGASEMALLAERHGAQVDRVAAAHSLRVLMVVVLIPFGFQFSGLHGVDAMAPAARLVDAAGLAVLTALTVSAGMLLRRLGLPSPFVLGALAVTMALTSHGVVLSALPKLATNAGQVFIGVALGTRFTRDFLRSGPRWLRSVALGTLGMMVLSIGFAGLLSVATGLHPATLILGTSPGGISEMSITAKVLQLGVPVVTGFHVVRYAAVLLVTGGLWRLEQARLARRAPH